MFIIGLGITAFALPSVISTIMALYVINAHSSAYGAASVSESYLLIRAVIFTALLIVGIALMIVGWLNRKNKSAVDSIINAQSQKYCSSCRINVSSQCANCPVCGKSLQNTK